MTTILTIIIYLSIFWLLCGIVAVVHYGPFPDVGTYVMCLLLGCLSFMSIFYVVEVIETTPKPFVVEEFNHWFKNIYSGYSGSPGAPGIFLRTDKLSICMITDYLEYLGHTEEAAIDQSHSLYLQVRKNWIEQLHND